MRAPDQADHVEDRSLHPEGHREMPATSDGVPDNNPPPPHDIVDEAEQRAAMLAELAEQREIMHESGVALPDADRTVGISVEEELSEIAGDEAGSARSAM